VVAIGIDIGGTKLKIGRVQEGYIVKRASAPTPHDFDELIDALLALVEEVSEGRPGIPVAAAVPGVFDDDKSMVLASPNLTFTINKPLRARLSDALQVPVRLGNDASLAGLAEKVYGNGEKYDDFLLATLGTGIGGGLILDGKLWDGTAGMAGEFGHMSVGGPFEKENVWQCGCGNWGCTETFASASRMEQRGKQSCGVDALPELADLARSGDPKALTVFRDAGTALGEGFAQVVLLLDIRVILIGGGASPVIDLLREPLLDQVVKRCAGRDREHYTVDRALLGNDAGLLGAAALALTVSG
jgi:glucokinase